LVEHSDCYTARSNVVGQDENLKLIRVDKSDARYPSSLVDCLKDQAPPTVMAHGNLELLQDKTLALFCSVRCLGMLILRAYDLARALRDANVAVIGGFHSPMEQECLALLLRGTQPIIICPARSIDGMHVPREWQAPLAKGRLLLLSPFEERHNRVTTSLARERNLFVAALAAEVFVAHATPSGKMESFAATALSWGKPLLTLESEENSGIVALGARPVKPEDYAPLLTDR